MPRVKLNLLDEEEQPVDSMEVESDQEHTLNGYLNTPDGGVYLICEVKTGAPPVDVEVTGIWIDGPHPTSRLG
jgi:hypothetical protein